MRLLIVIGLMICSIPALYAQSTLYRYGSSYGSIGLGVLNDFRGSGAEAMGIKGVAMASPSEANQANPAFWALNNTTTGSSGIVFRNTEYTDASTSSYGNQLELTQIQLIFPLVKTKVGMSLSLVPLTKSAFRTESLGLQSSNSSTLRYDSEITGTGGINKIEGGVGFKLLSNLYVGYATSMVFGSLKSKERITFSTSTVNPAQNEFIDNYLGWGNRLGFIYRSGAIGKKKSRIQLGGSLELPVSMRVHRQVDNYYIQVLSGGVLEQRKGIRLPDESSTLPMVYTVGATLFYNSKLTFATEVDYQQWSNFEHFENNSDIAYKDRLRIGGGLEYRPGNRFIGPFLSRLTYRAGVSVENGFFSILGQDITSTSATAGVSFPSPTSGSNIDLNVVYTNRGTISTNLINEQSLAIRLSFNLSELMFVKRLIQ